MTIVLKFCICIWFSQVVFASELVFSDLEKKPISEQQSVLEKRISENAKKDLKVDVEKDISFYLKINIPEATKMAFIMNNLKNSQSDRFSENVFSVFTKTLPMAKKIELATLLFDTKEVAGKKQFFVGIFEHISDANQIDQCLVDKSFCEKIISLLNKYEKGSFNGGIFQQSIYLGYYSLTNEILSKHKVESTDTWNYFAKCSMYLNLGQLAQASECFKKNTHPWYSLQNSIIEYLKNGRKTLPIDGFSTLKGNLFSETKGRERGLIYVYEYLLTGLIDEKELPDLMPLANSYQQGFMVLSLNNKYKKIPQKQAQELKEKYLKNFPGKVLTKILMGQEKPDKLKAQFGVNSLLYLCASSTL